jgi:hypothetical protein
MMPRWKLKDCPRCGGDIFMDIDEAGWLGHCLQCGYMGRAANMVPEPAASMINPVMKPAITSSFSRPLYFAKK